MTMVVVASLSCCLSLQTNEALGAAFQVIIDSHAALRPEVSFVGNCACCKELLLIDVSLMVIIIVSLFKLEE